MKTILKNSALVFVLVGLLGLPSLGFGMLKYDPEPVGSPVVLGATSLPADEVMPEVLGTSQKAVVTAQNNLKIIDQFSLNLNLSEDSNQTFYSIAPEKYEGEEYSFYVVLPSELYGENVTAEVVRNGTDLDLVFNAGTNVSLSSSLNVTILVLQ